MGDFEEALANFNDTLLYLRGNRHINYEQLGLKYKLYSCEVLFNRGLCYVYLKQNESGMSDLKYAVKEKETPEHDVIDEAIQEGAEVSWLLSKGARARADLAIGIHSLLYWRRHRVQAKQCQS